jgi:hypothetical protein
LSDTLSIKVRTSPCKIYDSFVNAANEPLVEFSPTVDKYKYNYKYKYKYDYSPVPHTSLATTMSSTSSKATTSYSSSRTTSTSSPLPYFSSYAFAMHSIPLSYALAYPPHLYLFTKFIKASNYAYTNMVPRANLERLGPSLPRETADMLWRARGCHFNALEGFPLFAAAMVRRQYLSTFTLHS